MIDQLRTEYVELSSPPDGADAPWFRERGRRFERLINSLLEHEHLEPRSAYRPEGEEIDGSFVFAERTYLLEAKWHRRPLPASALYAFKGKVDGKLLGTIGVFIAMGGFSNDAADALRAGKTPNVILFNAPDFHAALYTDAGFKGVLRTKLRAAAETGEVLFPFESMEVDVLDQDRPATIRDVLTTEIPIDKDHKILVVEGELGRRVMVELGSKVVRSLDRRRQFSILVAHGKYGLARLANTLVLRSGARPSYIIIADGDGDPKGVEQLLAQELEDQRIPIIVINPSLEAWLFPDTENLDRDIKELRSQGFDAIVNKAREADIDRIREKFDSFARFTDMLLS